MRPFPRARNNVIRATPKRFAACFSESKLGYLFVACMIQVHHNGCATSGAKGRDGKSNVLSGTIGIEMGVLSIPRWLVRKAVEITFVVKHNSQNACKILHLDSRFGPSNGKTAPVAFLTTCGRPLPNFDSFWHQARA